MHCTGAAKESRVEKNLLSSHLRSDPFGGRVVSVLKKDLVSNAELREIY